jgi:hypothetical protein
VQGAFSKLGKILVAATTPERGQPLLSNTAIMLRN